MIICLAELPTQAQEVNDMANFWQSDFMAKRRSQWANSIMRAQYYAGSSWYDAEITKKDVSGNNMNITIVTQDSDDLTITKFRLIDRDGTVAGLLEGESVTKKSTQGVLMQFTFPLYEIANE